MALLFMIILIAYFHENLKRTQVLLSYVHAMSREIAQTSDILDVEKCRTSEVVLGNSE